MSKISALIFSMNEYELIKPKVKLLYPYVDEIVIIDSSTDKNHKRLMKKLEKKYKKVRVIWLPPLGFVEAYYKIGINECKYEWIFQLDADDIPSKNLLKDLKKFVHQNYDAYKIFRKYRNHKSHEFLFRLIRKSSAYPSGLIHWVMASKSKNYKELDSGKYYILHEDRKESIKVSLKRAEKYRIIELMQIGAKILYFFERRDIHFWFERPKYLNKIYPFVKVLIYLGKLGLAILIFLWSYAYEMLISKRFKKFSPSQIKHATLFVLDCYKNFHYKYLAYKYQFEFGVNEFLGLEDKKEFLNISKKLNFGNDGLPNFLKLLDYRLKLFRFNLPHKKKN